MISLMTLLALLSCTGSSNNEDQGGKSRIERVQELPYRSMNISSDLKDKLDSVILSIWKNNPVESENEFVIFKVSDEGVKEKISHNSKELSTARNESYELWRNKDFEFTYLAYMSYVRNMESEKETPINVVEIEHEDLTGTYYLFISNDEEFDSQNLESNYVDRN